MPHFAEDFLSQLRSEELHDQTRVWLVGNSLGCATVGYLASRNEPLADAILIRNPPPLVEIVKRVARRYPLGYLTDRIAESLAPEMDLRCTGPSIHLPTVLLQSERDQLVPAELQNEVYESLGGPKRRVVMHGLDHDGVADEQHEPDIRAGVEWLWNQTLGS
jgi:pimeloyl-ACP methyl ester carboxylesterase